MKRQKKNPLMRHTSPKVDRFRYLIFSPRNSPLDELLRKGPNGLLLFS